MKKLVLLVSVFTLIFFSIYTSYINTNTTAAYKDYSINRVLYWGSRGDDVKQVQYRLLKWGYYTGKVDGIYGAGTYRAVRRFQRKNGLKIDGVVGPETAAALGLNFKSASSRGVTRDDNVYLLARAVHGEARGEPYIGKVAVAAVILNRVEHPSFPNTIASVIYQPGAFTAVSDGQINLTPDKDSIRAARDAINGWDPSYGSLYYWNPATATSRWIWSRKVIVKIGKHWFGK
ncbi:cell wall hydrolase [Caloranaerobacter azorensis H53214]|uniref:Spore cortex-lytic enzyme n=1 Tax=Caloranaerobacter azorensis H53214 TaxID=1156417 RepID=A0A096CUC5_9FIRM|nr:spore cortex-lytic enzyme [Caloranaerobacter azorensis]KGG80134.1 cell wall hydrolase [Caloranaerobacter azorensis H53214]